MSVDKIIKKIESDVDSKIQNIRSRRDDKAEKERNKIESEKEMKLDEIRKEMERKIKTSKNRIISQAKLESRKKKLRVREEMMEKVFKMAKEKLRSMDTSEYEDYLRLAIGKSANLLEGNIIIHCSPDAESKVKDLAGKISHDLEVKGDLDTTGGIKAVSDRGATMDLTFEAELERNKKELRKEISDILFKEEG
ncbi:MAG: V-type ATP synthase subunit E [Thermoplasmatota archaeon]